MSFDFIYGSWCVVWDAWYVWDRCVFRIRHILTFTFRLHTRCMESMVTNRRGLCVAVHIFILNDYEDETYTFLPQTSYILHRLGYSITSVPTSYWFPSYLPLSTKLTTKTENPSQNPLFFHNNSSISNPFSHPPSPLWRFW